VQPDIAAGYGFTAIIVAFLGRLNPLGALPAALMLAVSYIGGENAQILLKLPRRDRGVPGHAAVLPARRGHADPLAARSGAARRRRADGAVSRLGHGRGHAVPVRRDGRELVAERSGVLNLGVEGMMLMGAVTAFAVAFETGSTAWRCWPARSRGWRWRRCSR
jgi:hypothetical protein